MIKCTNNWTLTFRANITKTMTKRLFLYDVARFVTLIYSAIFSDWLNESWIFINTLGLVYGGQIVCTPLLYCSLNLENNEREYIKIMLSCLLVVQTYKRIMLMMKMMGIVMTDVADVVFQCKCPDSILFLLGIRSFYLCNIPFVQLFGFIYLFMFLKEAISMGMKWITLGIVKDVRSFK